MLHFAFQLQLVEKLVGLFLFEVHDNVKNLVDWVQNELAEGSNVVLRLGLGPLLGFQVKEVLTCGKVVLIFLPFSRYFFEVARFIRHPRPSKVQ